MRAALREPTPDGSGLSRAPDPHADAGSSSCLFDRVSGPPSILRRPQPRHEMIFPCTL